MAEQRVLRERFTQELESLRLGILELGSMVDKAVTDCMRALAERNIDLARDVVSRDKLINVKRFTIEEQVIDLLATQQPMARDLRFIAAVLVIAIELERMGDYARGIGEVTVRMGHAPLARPLGQLTQMADLARSMLSDALDAFARQDAPAARLLPVKDDAVDTINDQIYQELVELMITDPRMVTSATWLLWITHNLERLADRATNIAERVVFMVTGQLEEMDVSTY